MDNSILLLEERLINIEKLLIAQKSVLTLNEVAEYSGLSKSYLYKLTSTGGVPCYKPRAKALYFNREEIDQWLLRNRKCTVEETASKATTYTLLTGKGGSR